MKIDIENAYVTYAREPSAVARTLARGGERAAKAQNKCVLKGINASFESGKLYRIKGGNGSGKTTLLKLLSGLIKPVFGQIAVDGCAVLEKKAFILQEKTAISFAETELAFFAPSADEELTLPYKLTGKNIDVAEKEKAEIIEKMQLAELLKKSPLVLSKGEKQRLSFAIILMKIYVSNAVEFVLLDEPTSALDEEGLALFYAFLAELLQKNIGVIVVNHDANEGKILEELGAIQYEFSAGRFIAQTDKLTQRAEIVTEIISNEAEANTKCCSNTENCCEIGENISKGIECGDSKTEVGEKKINFSDNKNNAKKQIKRTVFDPRTKLLALVGISTFAVLTQDLWLLALLLALAFLVDLLVGADVMYAIKSIKGLLGMIFFIAIMQSLTVKGGTVYIAVFGAPLITSKGLTSAASFALRMLILVCSALIISKNDKTELVVALEKFGIPNSVAVMTVVAIGFIPVVREEYLTRLGALKIRGINVKGLSFFSKIKTYSYLLAPTLAGSVIYSERLAATMTSRAFRAYSRPTFYRRLTFRAADYFAIILIILFCAAAILTMIY